MAAITPEISSPPPRPPRKSILRALVRRARKWAKPLLRPIRDWQAPRIHRWMMHEVSRPVEVPGKSALIVAPHHDDETFGCGGIIALKRQAGIDVQVIILTDGRLSHGVQGTAESDRLNQTRKDEARAATALLGVPASCVHFLDLPDQGLWRLDPETRLSAIARLAAMFREFHPAEVYVNHRTDRHPDHEAAYALVADAISESAITLEVYQYPIWLVWKGPARLTLRPADLKGAVRVDVRSVQAQKDQAIAAYGSQLGVLPKGFVAQFEQGYEIFFR